MGNVYNKSVFYRIKLWCCTLAKIQCMPQWSLTIYEINYITSTKMSHGGYRLDKKSANEASNKNVIVPSISKKNSIDLKTYSFVNPLDSNAHNSVVLILSIQLCFYGKWNGNDISYCFVISYWINVLLCWSVFKI